MIGWKMLCGFALPVDKEELSLFIKTLLMRFLSFNLWI